MAKRTRSVQENDDDLEIRQVVEVTPTADLVDQVRHIQNIDSGEEEDNGFDDDFEILDEPPKNINERKSFSHVTCCICLDQPDILVVTPCGHVYCNDCVLRALSSTPRSTPTNGECSICKRRVKYKDIIYLEMKLKQQRSTSASKQPTPAHKTPTPAPS